MSTQNKKMLVTGFAPFDGDSFNPSMEAVKLLPEKIGGAEIIKAELPVLFDTAADQLLSLLENNKPDAVLCTGLAGGRKAITPEVIAVNLRNARIPDNAGNQPIWEKIDPYGPDGRFAVLPLQELTDSMKAADIPAELSFSAGTFVCNEVMYHLLAYQRTLFPEMLAGFMHVPYADEFPHPEEAFSLPLETIVRGLELCILEIVLP